MCCPTLTREYFLALPAWWWYPFLVPGWTCTSPISSRPCRSESWGRVLSRVTFRALLWEPVSSGPTQGTRGAAFPRRAFEPHVPTEEGSPSAVWGTCHRGSPAGESCSQVSSSGLCRDLWRWNLCLCLSYASQTCLAKETFFFGLKQYSSGRALEAVRTSGLDCSLQKVVFSPPPPACGRVQENTALFTGEDQPQVRLRPAWLGLDFPAEFAEGGRTPGEERTPFANSSLSWPSAWVLSLLHGFVRTWPGQRASVGKVI